MKTTVSPKRLLVFFPESPWIPATQATKGIVSGNNFIINDGFYRASHSVYIDIHSWIEAPYSMKQKGSCARRTLKASSGPQPHGKWYHFARSEWKWPWDRLRLGSLLGRSWSDTMTMGEGQGCRTALIKGRLRSGISFTPWLSVRGVSILCNYRAKCSLIRAKLFLENPLKPPSWYY